MKRSFLSNLNLEDDVIDKIMAEHGKTTQRLQDKFDTKDTELKQIQGELEDKDSKIKELEKIDVDKLKSEAEDWKNKYQNFEKDNAISDFFKEYNFTSDLAKKATIDEFKKQEFKLEDGKFEGADKFMEQFMKDNESAFALDKEEHEGVQTSTYSYSPASGDNSSTDAFTSGLEEIFGK